MRATDDLELSLDADELIDFTCATPWERLALDIELELRSWGLADGATPAAPVALTPRHADASASPLSPLPIAASRLALVPDKPLRLELRHAERNHWLHSHPLERLFDAPSHVMLCAPAADAVVADDPSAAAVLLSALAVAAAACGCTLPLFVPVGRPSTLRFVGRSMHAARPMRLTCDFTTRPSPDHYHLAGLLNLFHGKRAAVARGDAANAPPPPSLLLPPPCTKEVHIAAHFTYSWTDFSFRLAPPTDGLGADRRLVAAHATALANADPVRRLQLSAVWDRFPAKDLLCHTGLAAMPAESATRLRVSPPRELVDALRRPAARAPLPLTAPARQALRLAQHAIHCHGAGRVPAARLPLIEVGKSLTAVRPHKGRVSAAPPAREQPMSPRIAPTAAPSALSDFLDEVAQHLTLSALYDDRIDEEYLMSSVAALFDMGSGKDIMVDVVDALGPNVNDMDLLERVARLVGATETLASAQKLWNLFLDGVEVHWNMQWLVIGVPFSIHSGPDHNESLILQKLQMVNCCVERMRREKAGISVNPHGGDPDGSGRKGLLPDVQLIGSKDAAESDNDGWAKYDGRVWEPYVQSHPLVTRDMVEEELQRMVMRAEKSECSDETEAKRQLQTLKSDMSAFKAANPKAGLADFVRWFSPSDWIADVEETNEESGAGPEGPVIRGGSEGEEKEPWDNKPRAKGRMSARMSRDGNVWEELWRNAEAIRAAEQVPLFDAAAHGHKALGDLRAMGLGDVLAHLALVAAGSSANLLQAAFQKPPSVPLVEAHIEQARLSVRKLLRTRAALAPSGVLSVLGELSAAVEQTVAAEHAALVAQSVLIKLPPLDGMGAIAERIAVGESVDVYAETEKSVVIRVSGLDGGWRSTLLPDWREFVLESDGGDRMYSRVGADDIRVAFRLKLNYSL